MAVVVELDSVGTVTTVVAVVTERHSVLLETLAEVVVVVGHRVLVVCRVGQVALTTTEGLMESASTASNMVTWARLVPRLLRAITVVCLVTLWRSATTTLSVGSARRQDIWHVTATAIPCAISATFLVISLRSAPTKLNHSIACTGGGGGGDVVMSNEEAKQQALLLATRRWVEYRIKQHIRQSPPPSWSAY